MLLFSTDFNNKISIACNKFFAEKVYARKKHKDLEIIGRLSYELVQLEIKRPPEDVLQIILKFFKESLNNNAFKEKELFKSYVWELTDMMSTSINWNVNVDKYHPGFWHKLFLEVQTYLPKINMAETDVIKLKLPLLKNILVVTLMFDKENDFELIKFYWRFEMLLVLSAFPKAAAVDILTVATRCDKVKHLEQLVSKIVCDRLKQLGN